MNERVLDHLIDVLFASLGVGLLCAASYMRQPWLLLGLIPAAFAGTSLIQKLWRYKAVDRPNARGYRLSGEAEPPTTLRR